MVVKLPSSLCGVEFQKKNITALQCFTGKNMSKQGISNYSSAYLHCFFPAAPINRKLPIACITADVLNLLYNIQSRGDRG